MRNLIWLFLSSLSVASAWMAGTWVPQLDAMTTTRESIPIYYVDPVRITMETVDARISCSYSCQGTQLRCTNFRVEQMPRKFSYRHFHTFARIKQHGVLLDLTREEGEEDIVTVRWRIVRDPEPLPPDDQVVILKKLTHGVHDNPLT